MKKAFLNICFVIMMAVAIPAKAAVSDFANIFDINLEEDELPSLEALMQVFEKYDEYNRKYNSFYDLQGKFDNGFYAVLKSYGDMEKRFKPQDEDMLLEMISMFPKSYYQYIGPMLFDVPDMSEKILNLPGIKETKNKFPTVIANEVKDIEDIEFLSPEFYFLLMPESWPGHEKDIEQPKVTPYYPKIKYNPNFYASLKKLVKPESFMPGYKEKSSKTKSDLRTIYPTKDSLLTGADVKAFIATMDGVNAWSSKLENKALLAKIGILWSIYDNENEREIYIANGFKDMANPCARLVQKVRIAGREIELAKLVAPQGFTLNEWAYTCDKVIKAYHVANVSSGTVQALREFQRGIFDDSFKSLSTYSQNTQFVAMQFLIEVHKAPLKDVIEYKKNRKEFEDKLRQYHFEMFGFPFSRY